MALPSNLILALFKGSSQLALVRKINEILDYLLSVSPSGPGATTVASVSVTPSIYLPPGENAPLTPVAYDVNGEIIAGVIFTYSSSNTSVATVSLAGLVTAVTEGTAVITVTGGGRSALVNVTASIVTDVETVTVTPPLPDVLPGDTLQLIATARDNASVVLTGKTFVWSSENPAIVSVDSDGLVTAIAVGSTKIHALCEGVDGFTTVNVPLIFPGGGGYPALPFTLPNGLSHSTFTDEVTGTLENLAGVDIVSAVDPDYLQGGTATVVTITDSGNAVTNGTNLINAFNSNAARHKVIVLSPGVVYDCGATRLYAPSIAGTNWVYVVSSKVWDGTFTVTEGNRVTTAALSQMPIIRGSNNLGVIAHEGGTTGRTRWAGLCIESSWKDITSYCVNFGTVDPAYQANLAATAKFCVLDRCIVRPQPGTIDDGGGRMVPRGGQGGVGLCCEHGVVIGCRISGWYSAVKTDPNAIGVTNGPGPHLIENNYLEGCGEVVMFGGQAGQGAADMLPADIWMRRNHITKDLLWNPHHGSYPGNTNWLGNQAPGSKNLFEFKGGERVLIEDNVLRYSWHSGQDGFAIVMYNVNQVNNAPWNRVRNIHIRYNHFDYVKGFAHLVGKGDHPTDDTMNRIFIGNNKVTNMNDATCGSSIFSQAIKFVPSVPDGAREGCRDVHIIHNTFPYKTANRGGTDSYTVLFWAEKLADTAGVSRYEGLKIKDNVLGNGNGGIYSNDGAGQGSTTLDGHSGVGNWDVAGNVFIEPNANDYASTHPADNNYLPSINVAAHFTSPATDDWSLLIGSSFHGEASDGGDPGCDLEMLEDRLVGVE